MGCDYFIKKYFDDLCKMDIYDLFYLDYIAPSWLRTLLGADSHGSRRQPGAVPKRGCLIMNEPTAAQTQYYV